jgi:hypothetical protein
LEELHEVEGDDQASPGACGWGNGDESDRARDVGDSEEDHAEEGLTGFRDGPAVRLSD